MARTSSRQPRNKNKMARTEFKEGRFKEFEHYDANGQEDGEEKVESEKSGWVKDDEDEIDISIKHKSGHNKNKKAKPAATDSADNSSWDQFIGSTKKIVNTLKDEVADWYNGKSSSSSTKDESSSSSSSKATSTTSSKTSTKSSQKDTSASK